MLFVNLLGTVVPSYIATDICKIFIPQSKNVIFYQGVYHYF